MVPFLAPVPVLEHNGQIVNYIYKLSKLESKHKELTDANERLRKLDVAKSEFISIASHQLRTPLTVIKGYISMMIEGNFGKMSDTISDCLNKVYVSNERLINLVENLLNISYRIWQHQGFIVILINS